MIKKVVAILTIIVICISLVPFATFGTTTTPVKVTSDKENVVKGDIVTFSVSYGEIEQTLGSSEFELVIPDGLEYVEKSCVLTSNLDTILGVEKAEFTETNLKFVSSMSNEGYTSTNELQILTFKCKVTANSGNKTVTVKINDFSSDGYYNYIDMPTKVIPARINIKSEVSDIELSESSITIDKGQSQTIIAKIKPEDAINKDIIWESSNKDVAIVDNGIITAISRGKTIIKATTINNLSATCEVNVTQPIEKLTLNESIIQLQEQEGATLIASINPLDADGDKTITWTTDNSNVATVDEQGNVTAINKGTAIITATTQNNIIAKCSVVVGIPLESIYLNETNKELRKGESYKFTVIYNPSNTDASKEVLWESSDKEVATVDESGKVTVNKCTGTATITAVSIIDPSIKATATIVAQHKDSEFTYHPATESTCTKAGNIDYYECTGCGRKYKDSKGLEELGNVSLPIDFNAHDWDEWETVIEPTCEENGKMERKCKHNIEHKEIQSISKLSHSFIKVERDEPTCGKAGHIEHYECEHCHKCFKDSIGEIEISEMDILIQPLKHNELVKVEGKAATCVSEGKIEYWYCPDCGKKYKDNEGQEEINDITIPIDSESHDWGDWITEIEPTKNIVGKRTRICKNDPFHIETEYLYSIMEGDNQKYISNENESLTISANGNIDDLINLLVDDNEIDEECYTLESGSTVVTFNKEYLNTLGLGEHTLTFIYINGEVKASFVIEEKTLDQEQDTYSENSDYDYSKQDIYGYMNQTVKNNIETSRNSQDSQTSEETTPVNGYVITNLKKVAKKDTNQKENSDNNDNNYNNYYDGIEDEYFSEENDENSENNNDINKKEVKDISSKKSSNKIGIVAVFIILAIILIIAIIIVIKYKSKDHSENEEVVEENDKKEVKDEEKVEDNDK